VNLQKSERRKSRGPTAQSGVAPLLILDWRIVHVPRGTMSDLRSARSPPVPLFHVEHTPTSNPKSAIRSRNVPRGTFAISRDSAQIRATYRRCAVAEASPRLAIRRGRSMPALLRPSARSCAQARTISARAEMAMPAAAVGLPLTTGSCCEGDRAGHSPRLTEDAGHRRQNWQPDCRTTSFRASGPAAAQQAETSSPWALASAS